MLTLEQPTSDDWPAIGALADDAVRHVPGAPVQTEWLANRRAFAGARRHCIAREDGRIVGYAAIEAHQRGPRLFLVVRWTLPGAFDVADLLQSGLREAMRGETSGPLWLLEYSGDRPMRDYLLARGFASAATFDLDGTPVTRFEHPDFLRG